MSPLKTPATPVRGTVHLVVFLALAAGIAFAGYRTWAQEQYLYREALHKQLADIAALKISQLMAWQQERKGDALVADRSATMMPELERVMGPEPWPQAQADAR